MQIDLKNIIIIIALSFLIASCSKNQDNLDRISLSKIAEEKVIASEVSTDQLFNISMYSMIQANSSGLYVAPAGSFNDTVLYNYYKTNFCCYEYEGTISQGRGPNELQMVTSSTKTLNGDTLVFYSSSDSKYIFINENSEKIAYKYNPPETVNTGYVFTYNENVFVFPYTNPLIGGDYLLKIIDAKTGSETGAFKPRVPFGFEPAIRNEVFAMGALPNGFAISFVGDRKIYVLNNDGEIIKELIFGESEPLPTPYRIQNPNDAPASRPYLTKIEYYKEHLIILVDQVIWILDYPGYKVKHMLRIVRDSKEKTAPVIDFSIGGNMLFVRIGRDKLYYIKINPVWFSKD